MANSVFKLQLKDGDSIRLTLDLMVKDQTYYVKSTYSHNDIQSVTLDFNNLFKTYKCGHDHLLKLASDYSLTKQIST